MKSQRKQSGGVINRMPRPSTLQPRPITTAAELQKYFKFYSAIGHGGQPSVKDNTVFLIPERTWVLFVARAGEPTPKIKPTIDPILDDFRNLRPVGSKSPYCRPEPAPRTTEETPAEWHQRVLECMESGELFKTLLYNASNPKNITKMSIYQPGDLVQNIQLQFYNEYPPWDPVGFWELPLKTEDMAASLEKGRATYRQRIDEFLAENIPKLAEEKANIDAKDHAKFDDMLDFHKRESTLTYEEITARLGDLQDNIEYLIAHYPKFKFAYEAFAENKSIVGELLKSDQAIFDSLPGNKLRYFQDKVKVTRSTTLYDLLYREAYIQPDVLVNATKLQPVFEPGYRFIIIDTCRKAQDILPAPLRLTRSLSLSGRELANNSGAVCYTSLLTLSLQGFQQLLDQRKANPPPGLQDLLNGREVPLDMFQQIYTGKPIHEKLLQSNLANFLEFHKFKIGETVLFFIPDEGENPEEVTIVGFEPSSLTYTIQNIDTGEIGQGIPASYLWESEKSIAEHMQMETKNVLDIGKLVAKQQAQENLKKVATLKMQAYMNALEAKRKANNAARAEEQKKRNEAAATALQVEKERFLAETATHQEEINKLPPEDKAKIGFRTTVYIKEKKSPDKPEYEGRYGYVIGVGISKSTKKLVVAVEIQTIGGDALPKKAFPPSALGLGRGPPKKGGKRQTRRAKKSKKRQTRRS